MAAGRGWKGGSAGLWRTYQLGNCARRGRPRPDGRGEQEGDAVRRHRGPVVLNRADHDVLGCLGRRVGGHRSPRAARAAGRRGATQRRRPRRLLRRRRCGRPRDSRCARPRRARGGTRCWRRRGSVGVGILDTCAEALENRPTAYFGQIGFIKPISKNKMEECHSLSSTV